MADSSTDSENLAARVARLEAKTDGRRPVVSGRALVVVAVVLIATIAVAAALAHRSWDRSRIATAAADAAERLPDLAGYPLIFEVEDDALTATGLAPSQDARAALAKALDTIAKQEKLTLRLLVNTPPPAADRPVTARWAELKPFFADALSPVSAAAADAAIRIHDLEAALADAGAAIAARDAELAALRQDLTAASAARAEITLRLEQRMTALDRETDVLAAEIAAGERLAERRARRIADDLRAATADLSKQAADLTTDIRRLADAAAETDAALAETSSDLTAARAAAQTAAAERASAATDRADLAAKLDAGATARATLAKTVAALDTRVEAATNGLSAAKAALETIDGRLAVLKSDGEAAVAATTSLTGTLDDVIAETTEIGRRLGAVAERTAAIDRDMTALAAAAEARAEAAARLEATVAGWQGRIEAAAVAPSPSPAAIQTAPPAGAATPDVDARMTALEARAGEAIALLDQRIDQVAQAASGGQVRAASPLQAAQRQLAPLTIRFASLAQPASPAEAERTLARVGEIVLAMPEGMNLRIVGYADSDGTTEANRITSKRRSDWAMGELARFGVPSERMVSVGRGAERLLSPDASDDSPNRRVEFEAF